MRANEVVWHDPAEGLCTGLGVVVEPPGDDEDSVMLVKKDDGGEVECLACECTRG